MVNSVWTINTKQKKIKTVVSVIEADMEKEDKLVKLKQGVCCPHNIMQNIILSSLSYSTMVQTCK